ncbi:hypothetical protein FBR07_04420 [Candidatus Uhrbacteria bacterium UHB]|nr:hypothetical protein [Candidatus Uhrbacteria bacterium UHB]RIL00759.1 MAG: hypothetical protein DCC77_04465 [Candidatus Uhrbacteria bacterium]
MQRIDHAEAIDTLQLSTEQISDLQRICRDELGKELTLAEAEVLGGRMLRTFRLMFEISNRHKDPDQI